MPSEREFISSRKYRDREISVPKKSWDWPIWNKFVCYKTKTSVSKLTSAVKCKKHVTLNLQQHVISSSKNWKELNCGSTVYKIKRTIRNFKIKCSFLEFQWNYFMLFYAADGLKIEFFDFHDFMASVWQSCSSTWNNNFSLLLSSIVLLTSRKSKWKRKGTA